MLILRTLSRYSLLLILLASNAGAQDAVPRSTWWRNEYASGSIRGHRAPARDFNGYHSRSWGKNNGATVAGYTSIVWHHTEGVQNTNLVAMALEHRFVKRFCDIGYHFIIKRDGGRWRTFQGTPLGFVGSHCKGENCCRRTGIGRIGIAVAGNFNRDRVDSQLLAEMTRLQDVLVRRYRIREIRTHRLGSFAVNRAGDARDCPGRNMVPVVTSLRRRAESQVR